MSNEDFQTVTRNGGGKVSYLQQQIKNLQRRVNSPKTDLLETDDVYIVRMELPCDCFKWELKDNQILLVSLEKKMEYAEENVKEIYREARYGKLMRRVKLPGLVDNKPVSDDWKNGVWVVHFKKQSTNTSQNQSTPKFNELLGQDIDNSKSWADEM